MFEDSTGKNRKSNQKYKVYIGIGNLMRNIKSDWRLNSERKENNTRKMGRTNQFVRWDVDIWAFEEIQGAVGFGLFHPVIEPIHWFALRQLDG